MLKNLLFVHIQRIDSIMKEKIILSPSTVYNKIETSECITFCGSCSHLIAIEHFFIMKKNYIVYQEEF